MPNGKTTNNYTLRLPTPVRKVIEAGAAQRDEPLAPYIRKAALERARRELAMRDGSDQ